jgi:integrase
MLVERTRDAGARDLVFGYDWKDKDQLLRAFKKVINRYPINLASEDGYCFHSLRHSFGTWHFAAGTKPRNLMEMMGHANIATTLGYGHATDEGKQHDINNI